MDSRSTTPPPAKSAAVPASAASVPTPLGRESDPRGLTDLAVVPSSVWFGPVVPDSVERDFMSFLGAHNGVAVLTWPRDRAHLEHLARAGLPRLLLVPLTEAPPPAEPLQDWLPAGASHAEIHGRLLALSRAAEARRATAAPPTFDARGLLRVGDTSVAIPAGERVLAAILVTRFEQPVPAAALIAASATELQLPLQLRLWRLGRRVNTLGLEIVPGPGDANILRRCATGGTPSTSSPETRSVTVTTTPWCSPETVRPAAPIRKLGRRRALPMHFRSGLLAPELP